MRLIAKVHLTDPINKKPGEEFEIADGYAPALIMTNRAEKAPDKAVKRKYQRRDMTAIDDKVLAQDEIL